MAPVAASWAKTGEARSEEKIRMPGARTEARAMGVPPLIAMRLGGFAPAPYRRRAGWETRFFCSTKVRHPEVTRRGSFWGRVPERGRPRERPDKGAPKCAPVQVWF